MTVTSQQAKRRQELAHYMGAPPVEVRVPFAKGLPAFSPISFLQGLRCMQHAALSLWGGGWRMRQGYSSHGIFAQSLRYGSFLISPRELQFVFLPSFHDAIHKMPALALAVLTRVRGPQTGRVCSSQVALEVA